MLHNYYIIFQFTEILGKKWVAPLLIFLFIYEKDSFSGIKKQLKMTSRALSKKLKLLEAIGLVEKIVADNKNKAHYSLSEKGKTISKILLDVGRIV